MFAPHLICDCRGGCLGNGGWVGEDERAVVRARMSASSGSPEAQMVNWKQRELERARNAAMVRERQLRELREKEGEAERAAHDKQQEHNSSSAGTVKGGK